MDKKLVVAAARPASRDQEVTMQNAIDANRTELREIFRRLDVIRQNLNANGEPEAARFANDARKHVAGALSMLEGE